MTNKGLLGLPQGSKSTVASYTGRLFDRTLHRPDGAVATNNDYFTASIAAPNNTTYYQVLAAAPYDLFIRGCSSIYSSAPVSNSVIIALGPSGSERNVEVLSFPTVQEISVYASKDVYVPAGTRVSVRFISGASGTFSLTFHTSAALAPGKQIGIASTGLYLDLTGFLEVASAPLFANGCWITRIQATNYTSLANQVRLAFGSAGSEIPITAFMAAAGTTATTNNAYQVIKPIWWPPGVRLSAQGNFSSVTRPLSINVEVQDVI